MFITEDNKDPVPHVAPVSSIINPADRLLPKHSKCHCLVITSRRPLNLVYCSFVI